MLGKKITNSFSQNGIPDLEGVHFAIIGVAENRNDVNYIGDRFNFDAIRMALTVCSLGVGIPKLPILVIYYLVKRIEDTYFALTHLFLALIEKKIIPIIIGGSQDLTYTNYSAYDNITANDQYSKCRFQF